MAGFLVGILKGGERKSALDGRADANRVLPKKRGNAMVLLVND